MVKNIQSLRFVAALWAAIFHLDLVFGIKLDLPGWQQAARSGYAGVDLFFVISGYIMALTTATTDPGGRQAARFLAHRFARIYSGWWPFFFIYLAYFSTTRGIRTEQRLISSLFLAPTLLPHHLLEVAWTLSFELFFYCCTAFIIVFTRRKAWLLMLAWAAIVVGINIAWLMQGLYRPDNFAKISLAQWFFFYPLVLEFIAGFLLHEAFTKWQPRLLWPWIFGAFLMLMGVATYQQTQALFASGLAGFFHVSERAILWGGFAVCMVALAVTLEQLAVTPWPWMQPLGDASYSIYLGHILVFDVVTRFNPAAVSCCSNNGIYFGTTLFLLTAVAWLHHKTVEAPLYAAAKRLFAMFK